ncbi:N-acetyltransferase [Jiella sp. MQZ9-1]|uniref:N-acetyltransferase n=1 Tax=Jiella flava TaxID=2816857 RepID=A0A939JVL6_9HYPH|nr:N-acetyltransferase [Jiella flava]MBO0662092.1 N-acetyltransferase [Jiella flava]MCD2470580.1 N-acetyltransferase [Jiella flava]
MGAAVRIRPETKGDIAAIRDLTQTAFGAAPHSDGTEAAIIDALRAAGALTLSLVAVDPQGQIVGHVAFSPAGLSSGAADCYALGPIAVWPERQGEGIGSALVVEGLAQLKAVDAKACVLVGDPGFYGRFGFASDPALTYRDLPAKYVQCLVIVPPASMGEITFHAAFDVAV